MKTSIREFFESADQDKTIYYDNRDTFHAAGFDPIGKDERENSIAYFDWFMCKTYAEDLKEIAKRCGPEWAKLHWELSPWKWREQDERQERLVATIDLFISKRGIF